MCCSRAWHHLETNLVLDAKDAIHNMYALHLRSMSQHLSSVNVADSVDAFHVCLEMLVDGDSFAFVIVETCIGEVW